MPIVKDVKIVKVPLTDKERPPDIPMSFPKMPRLYLELFENKAKIKQDLINKEYIPPKGSDEPAPAAVSSDNKKPEENAEIKEDGSISKSKSESKSESDSETKSESGSESDSHSESGSESGSESETKQDDSISEVGTKKSSDTDDLSVRLKELLGDDKESSARSPSSSINISDKYSKPSKSMESKGKYTPYAKHVPPTQPREPKAEPPTLAELEQKGQFQRKPEIRDINNIPTSEYEEEDKKRELIFKFDLLRKSYPLAATTIPEYSIHSDLREMQKSYESTVKRLSLDSTVEGYKTYLIYGFIFVEFVFGKFLGFDMQGFTQQQITSMSSYERLLIELGEKSYVPTGSRWPVELRLLFLVIINAAFFIIGKMVMRSTGANLMSMLNSVTTPVQPPKPKRRMRGPNIDPEDIPDATDEAKNTVPTAPQAA